MTNENNTAEKQLTLHQKFTGLKGAIGVEVECLVLKNKLSSVNAFAKNKNWEMGFDGSIRGDNDTHESKEIKLRYDLEDLDKLFEDYEKLAESIVVNKSCGLHFHVSFKEPIIYFKLASYDFAKLFQDKIVALFRTEDEKYRLHCRFCSLYTNETNFLNVTSKQLSSVFRPGEPRYRAINYNAYNLHQTIEFRIFAPTTKIEVFKKYVLFLMKTIEDYIKDKSLTTEEIVLKDRMLETKPIKIEEFLL
jgi:hypothetical protein